VLIRTGSRRLKLQECRNVPGQTCKKLSQTQFIAICVRKNSRIVVARQHCRAICKPFMRTSTHCYAESETVVVGVSEKADVLCFSKKFHNARQDKADSLLTKFIVTNMRPISLVDDEAFREFVHFLEPDYQVPCQQTFCARLDGLKTERLKGVKTELASASSVAVTTGIWTSIANKPYISPTASYITPDWRLICRTLTNKPTEERHTQVWQQVN